jgi:hypothetical protein
MELLKQMKETSIIAASMADSSKKTVEQRETSNRRDGERNHIANFKWYLELCQQRDALLVSPNDATSKKMVSVINKEIGNMKKKLDLLEEDESMSE